jgi:hypothetical protein
MKLKLLPLFVLLLACSAAQASPGSRVSGQGGGGRQEMREERMREREQRREERRAQAPNDRREGRMTPEDRRAMREQIRDHGRDIYRDRPGSP